MLKILVMKRLQWVGKVKMSLTTEQFAQTLESLMMKPKSNRNQKNIQSTAKEKLKKIGLPSQKQSGYEYALLKPIYDALFSPFSDEKKMLIDKTAGQIVFINGVYQSELSDADVSVEKFSNVGMFTPYIQKMGMELVEKSVNPFVLLNHTLDSFGVFIRLDKGQKIDKPLRIINYITAHNETNLSFRIYFHLSKESSCKVQLIHKTETDQAPFNLVTYAKIEKDAVLDVQETVSKQSIGFHQIIADVKENGAFSSKLVNIAPKFFRADLKVNLEESGASAKLYGLNLTQQNNQAHFFAEVKHLAEETHSFQQIKNLSFDHSRTSFEGKIFVDQIAQKTKAYQLNQNLVLSDKAANFSKPNLEILADDVKASHGATFAKIDDEELFYLQSRGISKTNAKVMLIKSFLAEFIALMQDDATQNSLEQEIYSLLKERLC